MQQPADDYRVSCERSRRVFHGVPGVHRNAASEAGGLNPGVRPHKHKLQVFPLRCTLQPGHCVSIVSAFIKVKGSEQFLAEVIIATPY